MQRGERIALVGPSGCGKSTLLRVLAGLYPAQRGQVAVDGVLQTGRDATAELALLIPQESQIFEASLRQNLTLDQDGVDEAALREAIHVSALETVLVGLPQGLETLLCERGVNMSGGQCQRIALARGVLAARGRSLLLLDEPTSALDPVTEQLVHRRLDKAFPDACIVASVHRLHLLEHFDKVVFMVAGQVLDIGSVAELSARQPLFAAMRLGTEPAASAPALVV